MKRQVRQVENDGRDIATSADRLSQGLMWVSSGTSIDCSAAETATPVGVEHSDADGSRINREEQQ